MSSPTPAPPRGRPGLLELLEVVDRGDRLNPARAVFANRSLRMDGIEAIGFDMDYTLALYRMDAIERLSAERTVDKLIERGYPKSLRRIGYNREFVIRGLARRIARVLPASSATSDPQVSISEAETLILIVIFSSRTISGAGGAQLACLMNPMHMGMGKAEQMGSGWAGYSLVSVATKPDNLERVAVTQGRDGLHFRFIGKPRPRGCGKGVLECICWYRKGAG